MNVWQDMARRVLGPHSLRVVQAVRTVLDDMDDVDQIVVACSGGADSQALACAAAHLARRSESGLPPVSAAIIDHGLQEGSAEVAQKAAERLLAFGLRSEIRRVRVDEDSADGMESAARDARYQALVQMAGPSALILLGHTCDDQAETVLLGLARGSGTRSLSGMPQSFGDQPRFSRPLLGLRRSVTREACREWGIDVWSDPHNDNPMFARVRVRQTVLPMLEKELGPGLVEALARTASLARDDADALDRCALPLVPDPGQGLAVSSLRGLPDAVCSRVLRMWLVQGGVDQPSYGHLKSVRALVDDWHGQRGTDLPGHLRVSRNSGFLILAPAPPLSA